MAEGSNLKDVFVDELRDMYDAERQITKALPRMIKAASSGDLKAAFEGHLEETRTQIERLEQVFDAIELKARGVHCPGMSGILEEGKEVLEDDLDDAVLDAALVAAGQRVEHYEIAAYGTLVAFARELGLEEAAGLLEENLGEEKAADEKLSAIAEGGVNAAAARGAAGGAEQEESEMAAAGRKSRRR
jgi:ferritin-like metal-binding protein YciE